jgi:hypothetical protein
MSTLTKPIDADVAGKPSCAAADPNGPTGQLAAWVASTTLNDIPPSVRTHAMHLLLDAVACALLGAQLPVTEGRSYAPLRVRGACARCLAARRDGGHCTRTRRIQSHVAHARARGHPRPARGLTRARR